MELVTIDNDVFLSNVNSSNNSELDDFNTVTSFVDDDVMSRISPRRNIPTLMRGCVKNKIDHLLKIPVREYVDEPTDWVNQTAVVKKQNRDTVEFG